MVISKNELNELMELNKTPTLKQSYFKGYGNYNIYYKAQVIKNIDLGLILCKSYNTDIAIYCTISDVLYLDINYYNCSKTTKEQLDHFLNRYCYLHGKLNYTKILYLTSNEFNEISKIFYNEFDYLDYLDFEQKTLKRFYLLNNVLNKINDYNKYTYWKYFNFSNDYYETETIELKTRTKKVYHYKFDNLRLKEIKTFKKDKNKTVINGKIEISNKYCLIFDNRKMNDKKLYGGYDMGVSNNKNLTYRY